MQLGTSTARAAAVPHQCLKSRSEPLQFYSRPLVGRCHVLDSDDFAISTPCLRSRPATQANFLPRAWENTFCWNLALTIPTSSLLLLDKYSIVSTGNPFQPLYGNTYPIIELLYYLMLKNLCWFFRHVRTWSGFSEMGKYFSHERYGLSNGHVGPHFSTARGDFQMLEYHAPK